METEKAEGACLRARSEEEAELEMTLPTLLPAPTSLRTMTLPAPTAPIHPFKGPGTQRAGYYDAEKQNTRHG